MSDTKELEVKATSLETQAGQLVITNNAEYLAANEFGRACRALKKEIDASYDPIIEQAHLAHKAALDAKTKQLAPVLAAERLVNSKQITWHRAEEARIAEERRKAEEEARRRADEEAIRTAEALEAEGMHEAAEEALSAPVVERVVVAPVVKAEGTSYRETWSAEVLDLMALVKAVAAGTQPIVYLEANTTALGQAARMLKNTAAIPGVKIKSDTTIARR